MFTLKNFKKGKLYEDLYKDLYGYRPRDLVWDSPDAFEEDLEALREELEEVNASDDKDTTWEDDDDDSISLSDDALKHELGYNPFDDRFEDEWN